VAQGAVRQRVRLNFYYLCHDRKIQTHSLRMAQFRRESHRKPREGTLAQRAVDKEAKGNYGCFVPNVLTR
jgi:hypothetical protein